MAVATHPRIDVHENSLAGARAWFAQKPRALTDKLVTVAEAVRRCVHDGDYLAIGGFGADRMSEVAFDCGADGYLEKGVAFEEVISAVREAAERRRNRPRRPGGLHIIPLGC